MRVKVLAREVYFDGRGRLKGEEFDASDNWARGKIVLRQVEEVPGKPYRRADFQAPAVAAPAPVAPAVEFTEAAEVVEAPRRSYRTRVLKADDE